MSSLHVLSPALSGMEAEILARATQIHEKKIAAGLKSVHEVNLYQANVQLSVTAPIRHWSVEDRRRYMQAACLITLDGEPRGTGWHAGNGWVVSNQHVLAEIDDEGFPTYRTDGIAFHFFKIDERRYRLVG